MLSRPKLTEIDIIRAIAIIAVLVIHGTSGATQLPLGTGSHAVFFILNKASLFTVPLFIWISGVVLFYTYYDRWEPGNVAGFLDKTAAKNSDSLCPMVTFLLLVQSIHVSWHDCVLTFYT